MNSNKSIIILGNGYIGNYINNFLSNKGYKTFLISSKEYNYHDKKTMWHMLLNLEADVVINCSGFTGRPNIDQAEELKQDCWYYNVVSPLNIANLCNSFGIKHIHISSGCIYTGYDKEYSEEDTPNFGLWNNSSWYSKTKHAFEELSIDLPSKILRIRMPLSGDNERCFLSKIYNYENLINYVNSKTYIPDLCEFIHILLNDDSIKWNNRDIYNIVNSNPLDTMKVCELMFLAKRHNPKWEFVDISKIPIVAPRSNCILNNNKASKLMSFRNEFDALIECLNLGDLNLTESMLS